MCKSIQFGAAKYYSEKNVLKAQKWLQNTGSSIKLNGRFTIGMTTALCSYQRKKGLPTTGELDKVTWKTLKKDGKRKHLAK